MNTRRPHPTRKNRKMTILMRLVITAWTLMVWIPGLHAQPGNETWKAACDIRIPLHDRGAMIGFTRIPAGTNLEVITTGPPVEKNEIRLRHMNEVFVMPTGSDLEAALAEQNPDNASKSKPVFDLHAFSLAKRAAEFRKNHPNAAPVEELPATYTMEAATMEVPVDPAKEIPKGFAWDRTLIIPGKFGFIKLPFIKQTKPGICTAAASINAVCHLHPDVHLSGSELFRLYNNRANGASFHEAAIGNLQLGVKCRLAGITAASRPQMIEMIHHSIEANLPVVAADQRHALLIYGFNKETGKLFVWNQWGNGKIVDGMPKGTYLLKETDLAIEFKNLMFVSKVWFKPQESLQTSMEGKVGACEDLQVHPLPGSPFGSVEPYLEYSAPQRIKAGLRAGRTLLIPVRDEVLCVLPDEVQTDKAILQCRFFPSGKLTQHTVTSLTPLLFPTRGEFYSVRDSEKLSAYRKSGSAAACDKPEEARN